jgi:hypothetical protein
MSGGHFNYNQYQIGYIADDIDQLIRDNDSQEPGRAFSDETIAEFQRGVAVLRQALIYAQRIDWLVSGDDGEESFHARLKEDLEKQR